MRYDLPDTQPGLGIAAEVPDMDALIAEITGVRGDTRRVAFACDIGNTTVDGVWFLFGASKWVYVPRIAFQMTREQPMVNFWLVEMAEPMAKVLGIEDFILSDAEAETHRKRLSHETH
jgi:hypothetical protein